MTSDPEVGAGAFPRVWFGGEHSEHCVRDLAGSMLLNIYLKLKGNCHIAGGRGQVSDEPTNCQHVIGL